MMIISVLYVRSIRIQLVTKLKDLLVNFKRNVPNQDVALLKSYLDLVNAFSVLQTWYQITKREIVFQNHVPNYNSLIRMESVKPASHIVNKAKTQINIVRNQIVMKVNTLPLMPNVKSVKCFQDQVMIDIPAFKMNA